MLAIQAFTFCFQRLDGHKAQLNSGRLQGLQYQIGHQRLQPGAIERLTARFCIGHVGKTAGEVRITLAIVHGHSRAALAAEHSPSQQGCSTSRAEAELRAVISQGFLVLFPLFPGDVRGNLVAN